jgi:hypothetical protein
VSSSTDQPVCGSLLSKIVEQIERTGHLIAALPEERVDWAPGFDDAWPASRVLGHLLECLAGCCAVLYAAQPGQLRHFERLREARVNHPCGKDEALERLKIYRDHIEEGFGLLEDTDLGRKLPTVFVRGGETIATLLLGNLEHLVNHKHQLFTYLKLMGVSVGTRDLYHFRGI